MLHTMHYDYYQTSAYDNLVKGIRAYAVGGYSDKETPFDPRDEKRLLKRTKEFRDGFIFGLAAIDHLVPLNDYDTHFGDTINLTIDTVLQEYSDREYGIQMLEAFGSDVYDLSFGDRSRNPANPFRWLVSELAMDLYAPSQRDVNMQRFRGGVGLAYYTYVIMQKEFDKKFADITFDF